MSLGPAKINQQSITEELGDMALKTLDDFGACVLIGLHNVAQLFGV
ncbi:MAG: hypothetical protein QNJ58_19540 [Desulfobacterales bacterium]|nr:hypothetical protein [Desulfobacterales bacterium]